MRAATAAGREVFGYNRSIEGAQAATADGFDADTDLTATLSRAADSDALIVLAVPMPALPSMLAHVKETAPQCPLTDVTSVKKAVLDEVVAAGLRDRFVGATRWRAPRTRGGPPATRACSPGRPGWSASTTMSTRWCGRW
ncbi:prephenate dehydrogenase family protein [Mycobacterium avium subsp. avium 2285 (R)]|nr:prephenate dehydrogenase family protein [Mycobacterium avium subsp. avium 2285 (R)]